MPRATIARLDDLAFGSLRSRRDAAADDGPAKKALAPEPARPRRHAVDILARAEHEQEIGGLSGVRIRCCALIAAISASLGNAVGSIRHIGLALSSGNKLAEIAARRRVAKSRFIALDCGSVRTGCPSLSSPTDAISG